MKGKQILAGALALMMALSSCTKENGTEGSGGDSGENVVEGLSTYASISISQSARPGTYATNDGTAAEGAIKKATVVVVSDGIIRNRINITTTATQAFQTTTGKKYLYALVNVPDEFLKEIEENKTWAEVWDTLQELQTYAGFEMLIGGTNPDAATATGFWMSNFYGVEGVQPVVVVEATKEQVNAANDKDKKNNFTINVGRMVAKVSPTIATLEAACKGTLEGQKYRMRQYPKRFYHFQQYQADAAAPGGFLDQVITPYYSAEWVKNDDQDQQNKEWDPKTNDKVTTARDYFEDVKNTGTADNPVYEPDFKTLTLDANGDESKAASTYVTENTTEVGAKKKIRNKGTYLSIKATFDLTNSTGKVFLTAEGKEDPNGNTYTKGTTFYRIAHYTASGEIDFYCGGLYLAETLPTKVVGKDNWNWGDPIEFYSKEEADNDATGTIIEGEAKKAEDIAADEWRKDGTGAGYELVEYKDAECYYGMWLFDKNAGDNLSKKYSVLRNNLYAVNITSVKGLGDANEDDVVNKPDDVESDSYMVATIKVQPWNVVDVEGGI